MDNNEQDQPVESGPVRPKSVWADMVLSGADDENPEPGHAGPQDGVPSWPAAGLPPSFGQRSIEGERPAVAPPAPASGYGGFRPLGSLPPSGPPPGSLSPGGPARRQAGWQAPAGGDTEGGPDNGAGTEPGAEPGPRAGFGPWETYETAEGYGWTGGYGVVPEQGWAQSCDDPAEPVHDTDGARWAGGTQADPGAQASPEAHTGYGVDAGHRAEAESADSLTTDLLLPGRHGRPPSGWRRALYQVTGGLVRAPQSAADQRRRDLVQRARTPVASGHHRVAVLSLKGGVGKTTTTVGLGSTLASLRGDRVIVVDANPDRGTLSDKLRLETAATVRDLLNEEDQIRRYADVRAYTTQSPSGLEVLASDRDPTVSVAFSDQDYVDVARVLEHYYSVSITDCGTGLLHSAMAGVLRLADQIVLVSSPSVDGARSASATLDWLAAHNCGDLVRGAVVVLSAIRPRSKSAVDLARLEQHFAARCRAVVRIPYDAHLGEGAEVDLAQLGRATADAYLVLAAEVGDGFSRPRH